MKINISVKIVCLEDRALVIVGSPDFPDEPFHSVVKDDVAICQYVAESVGKFLSVRVK